MIMFLVFVFDRIFLMNFEILFIVFWKKVLKIEFEKYNFW